MPVLKAISWISDKQQQLLMGRNQVDAACIKLLQQEQELTSEAKPSRGASVPDVRMTERAFSATSANATAGLRHHKHSRTFHCERSLSLSAGLRHAEPFQAYNFMTLVLDLARAALVT